MKTPLQDSCTGADAVMIEIECSIMSKEDCNQLKKDRGCSLDLYLASTDPTACEYTAMICYSQYLGAAGDDFCSCMEGMSDCCEEIKNYQPDGCGYC